MNTRILVIILLCHVHGLFGQVELPPIMEYWYPSDSMGPELVPYPTGSITFPNIDGKRPIKDDYLLTDGYLSGKDNSNDDKIAYKGRFYGPRTSWWTQGERVDTSGQGTVDHVEINIYQVGQDIYLVHTLGNALVNIMPGRWRSHGSSYHYLPEIDQYAREGYYSNRPGTADAWANEGPFFEDVMEEVVKEGEVEDATPPEPKPRRQKQQVVYTSVDATRGLEFVWAGDSLFIKLVTRGDLRNPGKYVKTYALGKISPLGDPRESLTVETPTGSLEVYKKYQGELYGLETADGVMIAPPIFRSIDVHGYNTRHTFKGIDTAGVLHYYNTPYEEVDTNYFETLMTDAGERLEAYTYHTGFGRNLINPLGQPVFSSLNGGRYIVVSPSKNYIYTSRYENGAHYFYRISYPGLEVLDSMPGQLEEESYWQTYGLIAVNNDKEVSVIDMDRFETVFQADEANKIEPFPIGDNTYLYLVSEERRNTRLMTKSGKTLQIGGADEVNLLTPNLILVTEGPNSGFYSAELEQTSSFEAERITPIGKPLAAASDRAGNLAPNYGYYVAEYKDKRGLLDSTGNLLLPIQYDEIYYLVGWTVLLYEGEAQTLYDLKGRKILEEAIEISFSVSTAAPAEAIAEFLVKKRLLNVDTAEDAVFFYKEGRLFSYGRDRRRVDIDASILSERADLVDGYEELIESLREYAER